MRAPTQKTEFIGSVNYMDKKLMQWLCETNTKTSVSIIEIVEDENKIYGEDPAMLLVTSNDITEYLLQQIEFFQGFAEFGEDADTDKIIYENSLMLNLLEIYDFETTGVVYRYDLSEVA